MDARVQNRSYMPVVLILAGVQLSHILDFVILMPLGPQLMRALVIDTQQCSLLVSVYTFSAAISCFLASLVMDRFDRRQVLLAIYAGLVLGTFLCGMASSFAVLVSARVVTGVFGGLLQAIILSIIGDLVPAKEQGKATGIVMAAFAVSSVLGVPLGLAVANQFGWQMTFIGIGVFSVINWLLASWRVPSIKGHVAVGTKPQVWADLGALLGSPAMWLASLLIVSMMSIFALFPFISPFLVEVVGVSEMTLPQIYLVQGLATMIAAPLFGKMSDRFGPKRVFIVCSLAATVLVLMFSHLGSASLTNVLLLNTLLAAIGIGRMTPSMDLINRSVTSAQRGNFMTLVAAVQQLAASGASYLGGLMLSGVKGMGNFGYVGIMVAVSMVLSIGISVLIRSADQYSLNFHART